MQFKKLIALVLPIILAISTSGCVDINILKDFFEKKPPEYVWKEKILTKENETTWEDTTIPIPIPIGNQTITVLVGSNYTLVNYTFELKKDTKELRIEIENITEEFAITVLGQEFPIENAENYTDPLRGFGYEPHVNISIIDQNGKIVDSREYVDDENNIFFNISNPINGKWKISIESRIITVKGNLVGLPIEAKATWELVYTDPTAKAYEIK